MSISPFIKCKSYNMLHCGQTWLKDAMYVYPPNSVVRLFRFTASVRIDDN